MVIPTFKGTRWKYEKSGKGDLAVDNAQTRECIEGQHDIYGHTDLQRRRVKVWKKWQGRPRSGQCADPQMHRGSTWHKDRCPWQVVGLFRRWQHPRTDGTRGRLGDIRAKWRPFCIYIAQVPPRQVKNRVWTAHLQKNLSHSWCRGKDQGLNRLEIWIVGRNFWEMHGQAFGCSEASRPPPRLWI